MCKVQWSLTDGKSKGKGRAITVYAYQERCDNESEEAKMNCRDAISYWGWFSRRLGLHHD